MHLFCIGNHAIYLGINCNSALAIAVPYFQKIQREGESGRRKSISILVY